MKLGKRGLALLKHSEGLELEVYRDAAGVLTIGYGHTKTAHKHTKITPEQAEALLLLDVADAESAVCKAVKRPLEQHEFDALVCLAFNIGAEAFRNSTLARLINRGADRALVAAEFGRWVYAKGKKLRGLEVRRAAERDLFMGAE